MNIVDVLHSHVLAVVRQLSAGDVVPKDVDISGVTTVPPRDLAHGDVATNAAMVLARSAGAKPRELASKIAAKLEGLDVVGGVEIAGPGFINMWIADTAWHEALRAALRAGPDFGGSACVGVRRKVNVEYVSTNPTGPMHVGHARGACVGDVLANLLAKVGFDVVREYYCNDAGAQVDALARALHARYRQVCGDISAEDFDALKQCGDVQYGGDYLLDVAWSLRREDGDKWLTAPESLWLPALRDFAIKAMMDMICDDLRALGVTHDVFTSEKAVMATGRAEEARAVLEERGLLYVGVTEPPKGEKSQDWEPRPQLLFRSSQYGDDCDRSLVKSNGDWTYFAGDVAYHYDKYNRGFLRMINVFGADHGGYVKRITAAVKAFSDGAADLDVKVCQLVRCSENGRPVKMSKRAGVLIGLRDVVDRVGADAVRFLMLTRKNDVPLDFDLERATEQSKDNPVFYVQYAHARCCSVIARFKASDCGASAAELADDADLTLLTDCDERALIKLIAGWPRIVMSAAEAHEPHRLTYALHDIASAFHALWNKGRDHAELRFLYEDRPEISRARLALVNATASVIRSGLAIVGVKAPKEM